MFSTLITWQHNGIRQMVLAFLVKEGSARKRSVWDFATSVEWQGPVRTNGAFTALVLRMCARYQVLQQTAACLNVGRRLTEELD
jgi:hypothetical protein